MRRGMILPGINASVRMSPAMACSLEQRLWDVGDIVKLIEEWEGADMKRLLIIAISGLALTGCLKDFRQDAPEQRQVYKDKPTGVGDPSAISCYRPPMSMTQISQQDCRPNSEWARLHAADNHGGQNDIGGPTSASHVGVYH
jgi:hypothetical protein